MSEKQSTVGYINRCDDENCIIALADVYIYRVFDNNQHYTSCLGDASCAIMTMANGTYYRFDSHICDKKGFQNGKGAAILLYFQA